MDDPEIDLEDGAECGRSDDVHFDLKDDIEIGLEYDAEFGWSDDVLFGLKDETEMLILVRMMFALG